MKTKVYFLALIVGIFIVPTISMSQQVADLFDFPVENYSVNGYNFGGPSGVPGLVHVGEDCILPAGTPIKAISNGTVKLSKKDDAHYGQVVAIEHTLPSGEKVCSIYGHLSKKTEYPLTSTGAISLGQIIGYIGSDDENGDGNTHLHLGIRKGAYVALIEGRASTTDNFYPPIDFINQHRQSSQTDYLGLKQNNERDQRVIDFYNTHGGASTFGQVWGNPNSYLHLWPNNGDMWVQDFLNGNVWSWIIISPFDQLCYAIFNKLLEFYHSHNGRTTFGVPGENERLETYYGNNSSVGQSGQKIVVQKFKLNAADYLGKYLFCRDGQTANYQPLGTMVVEVPVGGYVCEAFNGGITTRLPDSWALDDNRFMRWITDPGSHNLRVFDASGNPFSNPSVLVMEGNEAVTTKSNIQYQGSNGSGSSGGSSSGDSSSGSGSGSTTPPPPQPTGFPLNLYWSDFQSFVTGSTDLNVNNWFAIYKIKYPQTGWVKTTVVAQATATVGNNQPAITVLVGKKSLPFSVKTGDSQTFILFSKVCVGDGYLELNLAEQTRYAGYGIRVEQLALNFVEAVPTDYTLPVFNPPIAQQTPVTPPPVTPPAPSTPTEPQNLNGTGQLVQRQLNLSGTMFGPGKYCYLVLAGGNNPLIWLDIPANGGQFAVPSGYDHANFTFSKQDNHWYWVGSDGKGRGNCVFQGFKFHNDWFWLNEITPLSPPPTETPAEKPPAAPPSTPPPVTPPPAPPTPNNLVLEVAAEKCTTTGAKNLKDGFVLLAKNWQKITGTIKIKTAGTYQLVLVAKGTYAGKDWPIADVKVNNQWVKKIKVATADWQEFVLTVKLKKGDNTWSATFTNDYFRNAKEDRNLYVDKIKILKPLTKEAEDEDVALESVVLPTTLCLEQNYPNPFNSATTIGFYLPQEMAIELVVCDMRGREVTRLQAGLSPAGWQQVHLDAGTFASGTYLIILHTAETRLVKKMTVVR